MRALVLVVLVGCHAGGGPVIALSGSGLRLGGEGGAGLGPVRATAGTTFAIAHDAPSRTYLTFDGGYASRLHASDDGDTVLLAYGAMFGYAWNSGPGGHTAYGAWAAPTMLNERCGAQIAFSAAVGIRVLGGITEAFVAPKVNAVGLPCIPN